MIIILKYIIKRLIMMLPVLLGVLLIVFIITEITPADPVKIMLGENAAPEQVAKLREEFKLDDPMLVRLGNYIYGIATRFDFGRSYETKQPILNEILARFPKTVILASLSVLISCVLGITLGIISATRQYSILDNLSTGIALLGVSMPNFWQGLMSIIVFSVWLGWLPASGSYGWQYWVLPSMTLGTSAAATIMRMTRSSMLEVIRQDYIRTARAKGQAEYIVVVRHALKNALIPIVTVIGIQFGGLLGGSVLIETIFAIPGLGKYMVDSIAKFDYPVVQGGVLFLAFVFSFVNLLVDIVYSYIDPRIKSQFKSVVKSSTVKS